MAPSRTLDLRLIRQAEAFTAEWLAEQRWFRGKSRPLRDVELIDAAPMPGTNAWLLVLAATHVDGAQSSYLVPAIEQDGRFREPRDGEGVWRSLVGMIAAGGSLSGRRAFLFEPAPGLGKMLGRDAIDTATLSERRLRGEQSNTSVVVGERLILKVYRLLEPGASPEVETNAFLSGVGFPHIPGLGGAVTYRHAGGEPSAAAMLQAFVPALGGGWEWVLHCLRGPAPGPAQAVSVISQIGHLTAELHAALASRPQDPDFPARPATETELAAWRSGAQGQLAQALAVVDGDARKRLSAIAPRLRAGLGAIESTLGARAARIHGDYHLGQLLRTQTGFVILDFEGEPARPISERRTPTSPLRDVAGMLRSLDYAWQFANHELDAAPAPEAWPGEARAAFLSAYGDLGPAGGLLLRAFEIEKACYEVRYEANNRPEWTWLPLGALERLAEAGNRAE